MMGWFGVVLGVVATALFYKTDSSVLMWTSAGVTLLNFWTWGIMHNQAVEAAKQRAEFSGGFYDLTERDLDSVSGGLTLANMATTVGIVGLLITALIFTFWN